MFLRLAATRVDRDSEESKVGSVRVPRGTFVCLAIPTRRSKAAAWPCSFAGSIAS